MAEGAGAEVRVRLGHLSRTSVRVRPAAGHVKCASPSPPNLRHIPARGDGCFTLFDFQSLKLPIFVDVPGTRGTRSEGATFLAIGFANSIGLRTVGLELG